MDKAMDRAELLQRVVDLRAQGLSPKQVARELGMRPAEVAPLLRQVAGAHRAARTARPLPEPAERELVGCWVSSGWSRGLGLDDAPQWAAVDAFEQEEALGGGLIGVMVARSDGASRVTVCAYLVDVFCLGVKNTLGPDQIRSGRLLDHARMYFSIFGSTPVTIPLELAQALVHGAVGYARGLGFEPHPDFAETAAYLGPAPPSCPIRFGRDGRPFFVSGPDDDVSAVLATLNRSAGDGNFEFLAGIS